MIRSKLLVSVLTLGIFALPVAPAFAASVAGPDGVISGGEYNWNTNGAEGSDKWNTHGGFQEYGDGSGGSPWDIGFMGIGVDNGQFRFGAQGGSILSGFTGAGHGPENGYWLSDIAINVVTPGETATDPTTDSSGWDYAIKLLGIVDQVASFGIFQTDADSEWVGRDIYDGSYAPKHITETFELVGGTQIGGFSGAYTEDGSALGHVLEGSFDLGLLGLFTEATGGRIITYLTMSCVNDEVLVDANVAAVPAPAAFWLFGSALIGFIGMSRRIRV